MHHRQIPARQVPRARVTPILPSFMQECHASGPAAGDVRQAELTPAGSIRVQSRIIRHARSFQLEVVKEVPTMVKQVCVASAAVLLAFAASGCIVQSTPRHRPPPAQQPPPPTAQPPVQTPPPAQQPPPTTPTPMVVPHMVPPGQIPGPSTTPPGTPSCQPGLHWDGTQCVPPVPPVARPPWQCPTGFHVVGDQCVKN